MEVIKKSFSSLLTLLLFSTLLLSFSCTKKTGQTSTEFKINVAALIGPTASNGASFNGGAILYGTNDRGDYFSKVINKTSIDDLVLPNGAWKFWVYLWVGNGSESSFTGEISCGLGTALLTGTDVSVVLNSSNSLCANGEFSKHFFLD